MKNSTIYKFIMTLILLLSVAGLIFFVSRTMSEKIESIKAQSLKDGLYENFEFGNELRDRMPSLLSEEEIIKKSFISSVNVLDFIRTLEDTAFARGLKITIDKVENEKEMPLTNSSMTLVDSKYTIQVSGSYDQILVFIEDLLKNEKNILINQLNIYRNETAGLVEYRAQIKLTGVILSYE
jgi:Tfp pilus assembly protein PilO